MKKILLAVVTLGTLIFSLYGCTKPADDENADAALMTKQYQSTGKKPAGMRSGTVGH